jgi:Winged helix-turn helix
MRAGIVVNVTPADRLRLEAIVADRSAPQKHVWRAKVILATADGCGTAEIMRRSGKSKPVVWTWQARFMAKGVEGLFGGWSIWPWGRRRAKAPTGRAGNLPRRPE